MAPAEGVPECPYVGLVPFGEQEASFFFGREREAETIVANLVAARLTLLYAPSGVGKSSVLLAGVLPRLRQLVADDVDDDDLDEEDVTQAGAVAYVSDWSSDRLQTVATAIHQAVGAPAGASGLDVGALRGLFADNCVTVLYLILDQFEEFLFYHRADAEEDRLLGELLTAHDLNIHLLLSIREDALAGLDRFKGRLPNLFDNYLRLAHLSRDAARTAIEGPLDEYNRRVPAKVAMAVDPELVAELLDQVRTGHVAVSPDGVRLSAPDAAGNTGFIEAPYLQLVLTRIWEQERRLASGVMRRATLDELGGAQNIVQTHLAMVMDALAPGQKAVAAEVFHHLVTPSGSKIALLATDLAAYSAQPVAEVEVLLEALSSGPRRILRPVPPAAGVVGPPRYEIFHDVMGIAVLEWRRQFVEERQREANKQLVADREEARADARTARRLLRSTWLAVGLVVVLLLVVGMGWLTVTSYRGQQQQKALAEANAALGRNPELSLSKAAEAYERGNTPESRSALLQAASAPRGDVVAGPASADGAITLIGMRIVPDKSHIFGYDRGGRVIVVGPDGARQAEVALQGPHDPVVDVAPAPDASRVAIATVNGDIAIVDVPSGHQTRFATGTKELTRIEWLGDAATGSVLVMDAKFTAATFRAATGAPLVRFPGLVVAATGIDGGRHVVTSADDTRLHVWDAAAAGPSLKDSEPIGDVPVMLKADGPLVVAVTNRLSPPNPDDVVIWNWQAGPTTVRAKVHAANGVQSVAITKSTVLVAFDKEVREFKLSNGEPFAILPKQSDWMYDVATSDDGHWTVTAGGDGQVLVWFEYGSIQPVRPTYELRGDGGSVLTAAFFGDGIVTLQSNGTMRHWGLPLPPRFAEHENWVLGLDLSSDGHTLATAGADGWGYILDTADITTRLAWFGQGNTDPLAAVRFDPKDPRRVFALPRYSSTPQLWQWSRSAGGTQPFLFDPAPLRSFNSLTSVDVSPDGSTVVAGDTEGGVHFWDSHTGQLLKDRERPGDGYAAWGVAFDPTDPSGRTLAVTVRDGIRVTGPDGADRVLQLQNPTGIAISAGGDVAAVADGGAVSVWTRSTSEPVKLVAHSSRLGRPAFSSDSALLAVGTAEGLVEVWDVRAGVAVALTRQHGDSVNDLRFTASGHSELITASDDMTVAEWPCAGCADPDKVIDDARNGH
jgi:WD40 repeat protein